MKRTFAALILGALLHAVPASAYSHFVHYAGSSSHPLVIREKFYLAQLPSNTVTFYVSDAGPRTYSGTDSFPSVLNQLRQATQVWNGVSTSALRVAFGGLYTQGLQDNSPGGEVVFEDLTPLPPGTLAYSGPTTREDQVSTDTETFRPILRSTMHLSQDLTRLPGPSFSETFFLLAVHEMGHALGLQHTFTSSAMSTIATRATSLLHPVDVDDAAGLSVLYPAFTFGAQTGSVTGRVSYSDNGSGVHMAFVMVFRSGAPAVSALTLPDGSYRIDGVPPGQYFVYAQPLPPSADIQFPTDSDGNAIPPGRPFNAVAYPGTTDLLSASTVGVSAGQSTAGVDFSVKPRSSVPIYDVALYSYFYPQNPFSNMVPVAVHPAYVNLTGGGSTVVAAGLGIAADGSTTTGLNVQVLGGGASLSNVRPYRAQGFTYLALDLQASPFSQTGTQHLLFSTPDYLYVLPSALNLVTSAPAFVSSVTPSDNGTVRVAATGLTSGAQIYFDALPSVLRSLDISNGVAVVVPPAGASSQTATVAAYGIDGQNSMFLQVNAPVTYTYESAPQPALSVSPSSLPAGAEAAVDVFGTATNFSEGATVFGFGTHDAVIRRTFVVSPSHAIVDVYVASGAAQITSQVTALTGFQMATSAQGFQVTAAQPGLPSVAPLLFNAVAGQAGAYPGAILTVYGKNLQASADAAPVLKFNNKTAVLLYTSPTQLNFRLPIDLPAGLADMTVSNGVASSFPVIVQVDPPQPLIVGAFLASSKISLDSVTAAHAGDVIDVVVSGFSNALSTIDASRVKVSAGGVTYAASSVNEVDASTVYRVEFRLSADAAAGSVVPLIVFIDGRSSSQASIMVAAGPR